MSTFIFRNSTLESLFSKSEEIVFSDYDGFQLNDYNYDNFIWFYTLPIKHNHQNLITEVNDYKKRLNIITSNIPKDKNFILFTLESIGSIRFEDTNFDLKNTIYEFNFFLHELSRIYKNIKLVDFSLFLKNYSEKSVIDWRYYFLSKAVINPKLSPEFNLWFESKLKSILQKRKKCLVLDLDNTLWGGILGEDGIEGVKLNENYPGNAFKRFQEIILEIKNHGVILAICSKNNISDVDELFEKHDEMVLKKNDFVVVKANWENKATNIKSIANELNIGLDSIVFIDDNPTERDLVRAMIPEVNVPEFPKKPFELVNFIYTIYEKYFGVYQMTSEDSDKTQQYLQNRNRSLLKTEFESIDSYIENLEIELELIKLNIINLSRFSQLTQKTNQFNLTTKRYSETDISSLANLGSWVYGLSVKDKFGDSGITGLIIIRFVNKITVEIDSFLMSCRVLGKNIENEFLKVMLNKLKNAGIIHVKSKFIETKKNKQVERFYDKSGFTKSSLIDENREKLYTLNLSEFKYENSNLYKFKKKE